MSSAQERGLCCFHDGSESLQDLGAEISGGGTLSETMTPFLFEDEDALGWFSQMLMNK